MHTMPRDQGSRKLPETLLFASQSKSGCWRAKYSSLSDTGRYCRMIIPRPPNLMCVPNCVFNSCAIWYGGWQRSSSTHLHRRPIHAKLQNRTAIFLSAGYMRLDFWRECPPAECSPPCSGKCAGAKQRRPVCWIAHTAVTSRVEKRLDAPPPSSPATHHHKK